MRNEAVNITKRIVKCCAMICAFEYVYCMGKGHMLGYLCRYDMTAHDALEALSYDDLPKVKRSLNRITRNFAILDMNREF